MKIEPTFNYASSFGNGLAPVQIDPNGNFGFINQAGDMVIPPRFAEARTFSDGIASVVIGTKYSYIDIHGATVINKEFDWASGFHGPFASVQIGPKPLQNEQFAANIFQIDKSGNVLRDPTCDLVP